MSSEPCQHRCCRAEGGAKLAQRSGIVIRMMVRVRKSLAWCFARRAVSTGLRMVGMRAIFRVRPLVLNGVIVPSVTLLQMRKRMRECADLPQNQQQTQHNTKCNTRLAHYDRRWLTAPIGYGPSLLVHRA